MSLTLTFLGTGTSHGVPMIGCPCAVCHSADPRDRRLRSSVLVEWPMADRDTPCRVVVDTGPDFRTQALAHGLTWLDALLFTHSHADHIFGLDDVRRFNHLQRAAMPAYADAMTAADLRHTFHYIFDQADQRGGGLPQVTLHEVAAPFALCGQSIIPVPVMHGRRPILGYRIGGLAYLTDCNAIPEASWPLLAGLDVLVLDALRDRAHPTHFSLEEAVAVATRVGARRTWFTHVCHELSHEATCARLPEGMALAHDGLVVTASAEAA